MRFHFDHLVHFVNSPEETVKHLRCLGLHAVLGGEHEQWGTYNALCYFDLSYIEFLGVNKPDVARQVTDNDLIRQAAATLPASEGFARIALRTDAIEEAAEWMQKQGLAVTGPFAGSRKRQDGSVVRWSMFFVREEGANGLHLPFVIQWGQPDEERKKDLQSRNVIFPHPAGPLAVAAVFFAVRDAEGAAEKWSRWFRLQRSGGYVDPDLQAQCVALELPGGNLVFCSPHGPGMVTEQLENRGEGPFLIRLTGSREKGIRPIRGGFYQFV